MLALPSSQRMPRPIQPGDFTMTANVTVVYEMSEGTARFCKSLTTAAIKYFENRNWTRRENS